MSRITITFEFSDYNGGFVWEGSPEDAASLIAGQEAAAARDGKDPADARFSALMQASYLLRQPEPVRQAAMAAIIGCALLDVGEPPNRPLDFFGLVDLDVGFSEDSSSRCVVDVAPVPDFGGVGSA